MSRRQEILRRATELFDRQGVAHTSIEDIAKSVGIKREGIYYYFKSREEILLEIILPQSQSLLLNLEGIQRSQMTSTEKLQAAMRAHLDKFYPSFLEMNVALREDHFFNDRKKLRELQRIWQDYSRLWTLLVEEGQQRGEFQPGLNPKMVAYGILGMCNWLSRWFDPSQGVTIPEIVDTYFSMVTGGILLREANDAPAESDAKAAAGS